MFSHDQRKLTIVQSYLQSTLIDQDLGSIDQYLLEDGVYHTQFGRVVGTVAVGNDLDSWFRIFKVIDYEVSEQHVDDNTVTIHLKETVQHIGKFKEIEATSEIITCNVVMRFLIKYPKIYSYFVFVNINDIVMQLVNHDIHKYSSVMQKPLIMDPYERSMLMIINTLKSFRVYLTIKQLQCLILWYVGKSDNEISQWQGISKSTVHYHQEQTKSKFRCYNKGQLFRNISRLNIEQLIYDCFSAMAQNKGMKLRIN